jgi:hypothetical protein
LGNTISFLQESIKSVLDDWEADWEDGVNNSITVRGKSGKTSHRLQGEMKILGKKIDDDTKP